MMEAEQDVAAMPVTKKAPGPAKRKSAGARYRGEEGRMGTGVARLASTTASAGLLDPRQAMAQPVSLRTTFAATAFFDPEIRTGDDGRATVSIPMPENLTSFRIMAVAVDPAAPDRFGHGDTTVRVRKPLMVRPSLPRFLNFGDAFEASVMVDNQTGDDQAVLVGTRGLNVEVADDDQVMFEDPGRRVARGPVRHEGPGRRHDAAAVRGA